MDNYGNAENRSESLRASDLLQDHRLSEHDKRLTEIQQAIITMKDNLQVLTGIDLKQTQIMSDIVEIKERQNRQGQFMDTWAIELEKVKSQSNLHHKIFGVVGKSVAGVLITTILGLIIVF